MLDIDKVDGPPKKHYIGIQVSEEVKLLWQSNFIVDQWKKLVMGMVIPALAEAIQKYGTGRFHTDVFNADRDGRKMKITISFERTRSDDKN